MDARALSRFMDPIKRRMLLMIGRALVEVVDDSTKMQALQVTLLEGEVRERVERFQNFGFTSVPEPGAEAVAAAVTGSRDHLVVVVVDDRRYRKTGLQPGESCQYNKWGDSVHLKDGVLEVTHRTKIRLVAPTVEVAGNMTVSGSIVAQGNITGAGISLNSHKHTGVQAGGAQTGGPV